MDRNYLDEKINNEFNINYLLTNPHESKINKLNADLEKAKYEAEEATGDQLNPYLATIESLKTIKINIITSKFCLTSNARLK